MNKLKGYNIPATPSAIEDKKDTRGAPYLKIRATVTIRGKQVERTIKAEGKARDALLPVLAVGTTTTIRGGFEKVAANEDGSRAEYIVAFGLPAEKKAA